MRVNSNGLKRKWEKHNMKIYIAENNKGSYSINETNWRSSKHYNLTYFHRAFEDALDYTEDMQELVNYYKGK